jgi:hypothetical protein
MNIQAALVKSILEKWSAYSWTIQGFGMVRTKIANVGRIHIWDSRVRSPLVSDVHAHPWDLYSAIISGELLNQKFVEVETDGLPYRKATLATGEGGGLVGEPQDVLLDMDSLEFLTVGEAYNQRSVEIHRSIPQDGTVTLMERFQGPPLQETVVYWPAGTSWVSAEPRPAQQWEIERSVKYALERWNA